MKVLYFLIGVFLVSCSHVRDHTVKAGETPERIAKRYQLSSQKLASLNGWADISRYFPDASRVKVSDAELELDSYPIRKISYIPRIPRFVWPVQGNISSAFGRRWGSFHSGIDIKADFGTPVKASAPGKVIFSGKEAGYGNLVILYHGNGFSTVYGHMSKRNVRKGQSVKKGQIIAYVGSTGRSTGPHLHFEVRKQQDPSNPLDYLP